MADDPDEKLPTFTRELTPQQSSVEDEASELARLRRELAREKQRNGQLEDRLKRQAKAQELMVRASPLPPHNALVPSHTGSPLRTHRRLACLSNLSERSHLRLQSQQAEREEEAIANRLMKRLETLKQEKEELARQVEVEEEMITNALTMKLQKVKQEKVNLEIQLEQEQEVSGQRCW